MSKILFPFRKHATLISVSLLAYTLSGCATTPVTSNSQQYYDAAIADAAVATPQKVSDLLPLPAGPTVTVISWVTESRAPCRADEAQCALSVGADRLWVTLAGEVQTMCRSWKLSGDPLRRRLEQLLGLPLDSPPQYRKAKFVSIEVARDRLERACLGVDETDVAHPRCTYTGKQNASAELKNFVGQQRAGSYVTGNPNGPGYPFTRLGYTYDWNPATTARNHYGASEFLIAPNTIAKAISQVTTDEYCKP
jgi:hypothetical protein